MTNPSQQQGTMKRFFRYAKVWITDRKARNYNIDVQRTFAAAETEPSKFLRVELYQIFNITMLLAPSRVSEETVKSYINLLTKDSSHYLRGIHFLELKFLLLKAGKAFRDRQYPTDAIHRALTNALYLEQQGLKPFTVGSAARGQRQKVVGYIQLLVDMFEPEPPTPSNRAERRRAAKRNRQQGGPPRN